MQILVQLGPGRGQFSRKVQQVVRSNPELSIDRQHSGPCTFSCHLSVGFYLEYARGQQVMRGFFPLSQSPSLTLFLSPQTGSRLQRTAVRCKKLHQLLRLHLLSDNCILSELVSRRCDSLYVSDPKLTEKGMKRTQQLVVSSLLS